MKRVLLKISLAVLLVQGSVPSHGQGRMMEAFKAVCDTMGVRTAERTGVRTELRLKSVMKRGGVLDFYFTESLCDYPWRAEDIKWFRNELKSCFPEEYSSYRLGEIYARRDRIQALATDPIDFNGLPSSARNRTKNPAGLKVVSRTAKPGFPKGLDGRNIALWASHGRYYDVALDRWRWQRPTLFMTVEDLFTSSFVLSFLAPMLENAGAGVFMPRERDTNPIEVIADNDPGAGVRGKAEYSESGDWKDAGIGFADTKEYYIGHENPFKAGTARSAVCIQSKKGATARAVWRPEIPQRDEYAVYVSYKTLPNSTSAASYTVRHLGGETKFTVNQKCGGGTWIYLGTFEFGEGSDGAVILDNACPEGHKFENGSVVTADAVKFGGGMGNIARGSQGSDGSVSGLPRYAEGARYWLQWAGMDSTCFSFHDQADDYRDDLFCRGDWANFLAGGSRVNPSSPGLKVPVDLCLAFHSDATVTPNDSTVGTLVIYSRMNKSLKTLPSGEDRLTTREFADIVQSQVTADLRTIADPAWRRRQISDRAYRECRTSTMPAMLFESLSHQNFADMRYGLDPEVRFILSRAVYKGILKYLSNRYGCPYAVQPLPVNSFAAVPDGGKVRLSWKPTEDSLEPTAVPKGYIIYTRKDDGGFDSGRIVEAVKDAKGMFHTEVGTEAGHIYSFRVSAYNDGGESFPSEVLAVGTSGRKDAEKVLIVNNFTRVSAPAWFDTPTYAGFDVRKDCGVPYMKDISYIGDMYRFQRGLPWIEDDNPGFGASFDDKAGRRVTGNTFDYPSIHGKEFFEAGYDFVSVSSLAFEADSTLWRGFALTDIICGKQATTPLGGTCGKTGFTVFTEGMQNALRGVCSNGGGILVSGSSIGTDIWSGVYPVPADSAFRASSVRFAQDVLGFRWKSDFATQSGKVVCISGEGLPDGKGAEGTFNLSDACGSVYAVGNADSIAPASERGCVLMEYGDTRRSAATGFVSKDGHKAVCVGFPLETLTEGKDAIFSSILKFFGL
ncbi:MAG: xanthan lyase [Candidatus Cryptobacteroides sp.]